MEERETLFTVTTPPGMKKLSNMLKKPSYYPDETHTQAAQSLYTKGSQNQSQDKPDAAMQLAQQPKQQERHEVWSDGASAGKDAMYFSSSAQQEKFLQMSEERYQSLLESTGGRAFVPTTPLPTNHSRVQAFTPTVQHNASITQLKRPLVRLRAQPSGSLFKAEKYEVEKLRDQSIVSPRTASIPNNYCSSPSNLGTGVTTSTTPDARYQRTYVKYFESGLFDKEFIDCYTHRHLYAKTNEDYGHQRQINGREIAILKYNNQFYAFDAHCCHQQAPLHKGLLCTIDIEDAHLMPNTCGNDEQEEKGRLCIQCPRHHWKFDVFTGECLSNDQFVQQTYPCIVDPINQEVKVGFEDFDQKCFDSEDF